ncbi:MAG: aldehyde ferredoxin oxidoreductase C-terminal domain-containing protein [Ignisphaera sp.]
MVELDRMLDDYYTARGWDVKTGIPTRRKLEELGLAYVAEELTKLGRLPAG